jgi:hypothetical protein
MTVVHQLIELNFQSARELLQSFNGWGRMSVLDARDVATEQTGTSLDVTLR